MDMQERTYSKEEFMETASGNKVSRKAFLPASQNIVLSGKVIVQHDAFIRADLANVRVGRFSILSNGCNLRPPWKKFSRGVAYFPLHVGDYTFIGENTIIEAASVGSYCYIGKNVVIGKRCVLKDCCMIEDNSVVSADSVIPSFTRFGGSPACAAHDLPECTQDLMTDYCKRYYELFKPELPIGAQGMLWIIPLEKAKRKW